MDSFLIPDKIIKSKRKSISLLIDENGKFIARLPMYSTLDQLNSFILKKSDWIKRKRSEAERNSIKPLNIVNGLVIFLAESPYKIVFTEGNSRVNKDIIFVNVKNIKQSLISNVKKITKIYICERIKELNNNLNFKYNSISISSARTNWGSCSSNNNLHFSYKLIFCPRFVIDYVIFHELTHIKVKNHSKRFWQELDKICPNHKTGELWLKSNRSIINLI